MLLSSDLTLRLPGWYEAELYDRVQCPDLGGTENWFVAEIRRQIERRGIFTTLVLRDRSYL